MPASDPSTSPVPDPGGKILFADDEARALLTDEAPSFRDPDPSTWEQVKHNPSRTVYRGRIGGRDVYLKRYHSRTIIHRIARALGLSEAKREMAFARYLSAHGVRTATVLAAACGNGAEWLISHAVAPAMRADLWHNAQLKLASDGRRAIRQATIAFARMIGLMHAAGITHRDLHCGNVLVRTDGRKPRLVLTDLHRAARRLRLSRRARVSSLAQLFHDRYTFTTRTERLRFLEHYMRASGAEGTLRGWQLMVEDSARRHTRRQHSQRDRRIFGDNRYFARMKLARGWRGHAVLASKRHMAQSKAAELEFPPDGWREALDPPEALFDGDDVTIIKDSPSSLVVRRKLRVGEHTLDVFIKRSRRKRWWKAIADCFRSARSLKGFRLGHELLTRRISTALPLVALERRAGPFLLDNILVSEAADSPRLHEFLQTWLSVPPRGDVPLAVPEQRHLAQAVLWLLGRLVRQLHDNSFAHRDLKATNILVPWSPGAAPELVLVDLDGMKRLRHVSARRKFQGLMRLNVSLLKCTTVNRAGRLRMLLGYLRRPGSGRINFKPYWRVLDRWSDRKLKAQIRSRRRRQRARRRPAT